MCGIFGLIDNKSNGGATAPLIEAMRLVRHRGPDDEGYLLWAGDGPVVYAGAETNTASRQYHNLIDLPDDARWRAALGHRRLSIIDLSPAAHQPMVDPRTGRAVVYNGEIYNYLELRRELAHRGHPFRSHSDTEVILAAWDQWGPECLDRFNGMFAFLLLDPRTSRLHAVRDRFGVKPLYWARIGASIVFASEIKQIRAFPGFVPRLNTSAVRDYLADGLLDHTRCTFDEGIEQLLGGERAIVRLDCDNPGVEIVRWYELKAETWRGTDEGAAVRFEELLSDSVRVRLRSDVPVGSCLSGGLDSSSIVCLAHRALKEQGGQARQVTVTACFEDERFDEWRYAEKVIAQTEAIAVRVWPSFEQLEQEWDRFLWQMDEPCGSTSQFSQWRVFDGAAGAGLKVMLDGQGSDEQLAGYSGGTPIALLTGLLSRRTVGSFVGEVMAMRRARGRLPLAEMALAARNIFPPLTSLLPARLRNGNSKPDWLRLDAPPLTSRKAGALCDALRQQTLSTSLPALLRYEDRNSMAWSVESRVPFLDYRLVEFLAGLPDHLKLHRTITKVVLREGMRGIIPEDIRQRRDKMGFVTPEEVWLRETAPTWFRRNIEASLRAAPHIFDAERVRRMLEDMISGRAGFTFAPWRIACLGRWLSISAGRAGDSDASVRN